MYHTQATEKLGQGFRTSQLFRQILPTGMVIVLKDSYFGGSHMGSDLIPDNA